MRGILSIAGYVPHHRLRRDEIAAVLGGDGGRGRRAVASYDEDATTLAVAAGRYALATADPTPRAVWFATSTPAYLDKSNATTVHAALRLDQEALAMDVAGAPRAGIAALIAALRSNEPTLVVAADVRTGLPGSSDERDTGDAGAAVFVGSDTDGPVLAEVLATASATEEFLDRWRVPGEIRSRTWEERFGETRYVPLVRDVVKRALAAADLTTVDHTIVTGLHRRAVGRAAKAVASTGTLVDDLHDAVGVTGTPHPLLLLSATLESTEPGRTVLLVSLADGADAVVLRTTEAIATWRPHAEMASQIGAGDDRLRYADFLGWRGVLTREPPRRPEPARVSAPAAGRAADWKFGFVGSEDRSTGAVHLPPSRVSYRGGAVDDMTAAPMADTEATVATFTVDHLAWSPAPPTVFAVLDFDGGGRFACELTDVEPDAVAIGDRVEMTFRLLNQADGIRNYFWKARPVRRKDA